MRMTHRLPVCFAVLIMMGLGCRGADARRDLDHTIVVRHAGPADGHFDTGEPHDPERIDVVVAGPRAAGRATPLSSLVGKSCKVQFRRDALGLAAPAPIPPTGRGPGGRAVSIEGTVRSISGAWIELERDGQTYWVAQSSILLIEVPEQPLTTSPSVE